MRYIKNVFFGLFLISNFIYSNDRHQMVRLFDPTSQTLNTISSIGVPLDHATGKKGIYLDIVIEEAQTFELISRGLDIEVLISDMTEYYRARNVPSAERNFPLGSMQGNYTWDELNNRFDELQSSYPNIISERLIIGESLEGRDIWAFKISDNPNNDEDESEVLYTALTHAREPLGMMNLFYFIQMIGEGYGLDTELTYLVNNREMWFVPVVNPDGYIYNESIQPDGGGMHRKNRRDTNCGNGTSRGVDLNRNYGYGWGANDTGSSPDPCSTTYRGDGAFSEPETQVIRDFILNHDFKNVLHYHSYSNVYIHAFGDASLPDEPDLTTLRDIGNEMATFNGYTVGTGYDVIGYTVNGDAVDWTFGEQNIISYTPEVGSSSQGFWPSENDIIQLCSDQMYSNKVFAFIAGADIVLSSYTISNGAILPGDELDIEIVIQNRGLTNSTSDIDISIMTNDDWVSLEDQNYIISEMDARDSDDFSITININEAAPPGVYSDIIISIESENSLTRQDTIQFLIGQPNTLFFDGFETGLSSWDLNGDWGITDDAASESFALTDSPEGEYQAGQESIAELITVVDLQYISNPQINFKAKWDIESNWDFVRLQAFVVDSGWISLEGIYTEPGTGQPAQPLGEHGYDGTQSEWINEVVHLDHLNGEEISSFRFIQTSDNFVEGDGFTFDDFSILGFPLGLMGDFNMDMSVNIFDLLSIADLLLFGDAPSETQLFFCDFDGNGVLDVMDLISIANIILGL